MQKKSVPQGQTVSQIFYRKVHEWLWKRVICIQTLLTLGLMHHDNAPCRNVLAVSKVLTSKHTAVVPQPQYSPYVPHVTFFFPFPRITNCLRGQEFKTIDNIHRAINDTRKDLTDEKFQQYASRGGSTAPIGVLFPEGPTLKGIMLKCKKF